HFTATRSLGAGEIWIYHITGGNGVQLTTRKNDQQDVNEPAVSPDGRYVYFSEDMYPGGMFQYNKDPNNEIYVIRRFDREKGIVENITGGAGSAFRPQVSPDGKLLAFVKRVRVKTVLYLRDLNTGEEWPVYDKLSKDQTEAWSIFGVYTGFAWLPGNKQLIVWANGKINKVNLDGSNTSTEIPFICNVKQRITDAVRFGQNFNQDSFKVNVIRQARTSPDGKWLVFNAVGYLWKKALPDGKPERITTGNDFEFEPAFSKEILNIIPQKIIDSLRLQGMVINEGTTPPKIEGSYFADKANCFFDSSNFPRLGIWRANYTYTLYNQNNTDLTLSIDYFAHPRNIDEATGKGSFISGSGDKFSAFFLTEGVSKEVPYKMIYIISGRKTADGVVDWHDCLRMMEKGDDPTNKLIAVGGTRIFKEDDGLASNIDPDLDKKLAGFNTSLKESIIAGK
ncbi:MAG: hypothetical protein EOO01_29585, partial [Chitinophagaceae bacterium]